MQDTKQPISSSGEIERSFIPCPESEAYIKQLEEKISILESRLHEERNFKSFHDGFVSGYMQCSADEESGDWTESSEQLHQYADLYAHTYMNSFGELKSKHNDNGGI